MQLRRANCQCNCVWVLQNDDADPVDPADAGRSPSSRSSPGVASGLRHTHTHTHNVMHACNCTYTHTHTMSCIHVIAHTHTVSCTHVTAHVHTGLHCGAKAGRGVRRPRLVVQCKQHSTRQQAQNTKRSHSPSAQRLHRNSQTRRWRRQAAGAELRGVRHWEA